MTNPRTQSMLTIVMMFASTAATAQIVDIPADTTPTDVYREVESVARDVEHLRIYMGRPPNTQTPIDVSGVSPREVIYQAGTLCEKVNRLGFETIREIAEKPVVPDGETKPVDVLRMVSFAHDQVRRIGVGFGLEFASPDAAPTGTQTPTDVFKAIVQLNRQINLLLDEQFSPSDVFEEVSLAIAHAANLRSQWPGDRIAAAPASEFGKRPADVMRRLARCAEVVRLIAESEDLQVLQFRLDESSLQAVTPSDVYDVAALLVSELAYLDRTLVDTHDVRKARYPGRKVPSDVYQRAGILLKQLEEIEELSSTVTPQAGC